MHRGRIAFAARTKRIECFAIHSGTIRSNWPDRGLSGAFAYSADIDANRSATGPNPVD